MTAASPWSVKGIDPKARELAKDLARRSGMTLGEWLNQMIIEGEAEGADEPEYERALRSASRRDIRLPPERDDDRRGEPDVRRIARALDALAARLEAAEHRSTLAISGIDQSVMGVLSRIDAVERDRASVAARFEGELEEVRAGQARVADRLRRLSDEDGPRHEAMRALEGAIGKIAEKVFDAEAKTRAVLNEAREDVSHAVRRIDRLEARVEGDPAPALVDALAGRVADRVSTDFIARLGEAEGRTTAAMRSLEASFSGLDSRLRSMESSDLRDRFEVLATELSQKVEVQRAEIADQIARLADTRVDGLENGLGALDDRLRHAEQQSAVAIDRMGREVMRIAQTLGERVASVEARSAEATQQIGGEMARIAQAMEGRMARSDQAQAEALEKLGGEISRIAERLADRIAHAERRSAQAVDDVSGELGRAAEQITARHDAGHAALADRIRASEERTARLLDEARAAIDQRLSDRIEANPAVVPAVATDDRHDGGVGGGPETGSGAGSGAAVGLAAPSSNDAPVQDWAAPAWDGGLSADRAATLTPTPASDWDLVSGAASTGPALHASADAAADPFTGFQDTFSASLAATASLEADHGFPTSRGAVADEPPSTRDVVAQARAAARAAAEKTDRRNREPRLDTALAPEAARFSFSLPGKKKRRDDALRTFLTASGTAAALAATAVGATLYLGTEAHRSDQVDRSNPPPTAARNDAAPPASASAPDAKPDRPADGIAASALSGPDPSAPAPDDTGAGAANAVTPRSDAAAMAALVKPVEAQPLYNSAVGRLAAGDPSGVDDLKKAANLGFVPAQFYLYKLYELGGPGVKKDLAEARRWIERAAQGGDPQAMHNLAIFELNGEGGPRSPEQAVTWFSRAASHGLVDSQFNLGRIYEVGGFGIPQNRVEAYKWYLLAAAGGDHDAKTAAETLKAKLPADQARAAERSALAFKPVKSDKVAG